MDNTEDVLRSCCLSLWGAHLKELKISGEAGTKWNWIEPRGKQENNGKRDGGGERGISIEIDCTLFGAIRNTNYRFRRKERNAASWNWKESIFFCLPTPLLALSLSIFGPSPRRRENIRVHVQGERKMNLEWREALATSFVRPFWVFLMDWGSFPKEIWRKTRIYLIRNRQE